MSKFLNSERYGGKNGKTKMAERSLKNLGKREVSPPHPEPLTYFVLFSLMLSGFIYGLTEASQLNHLR